MFYGSPGQPGNIGYLSQAKPNPLTDPRNKIRGGEPWTKDVRLPGEKETFDKPFIPLPSPGQNVPLAQGALGIMGNIGVPQMPLPSLSGTMPMGNAGYFSGRQYAQGIPPAGFQNKTLS
jgi:hypothetical protein